jgi:hypothetical protein
MSVQTLLGGSLRFAAFTDTGMLAGAGIQEVLYCLVSARSPRDPAAYASSPLRSAERMGSSADPVNASTAALISCTSLKPFGNVAELPGWPFLVSRLSTASSGVLDPLARLDSPFSGGLARGMLLSPHTHCGVS